VDRVRSNSLRRSFVVGDVLGELDLVELHWLQDLDAGQSERYQSAIAVPISSGESS
jgi:hypothetical protein